MKKIVTLIIFLLFTFFFNLRNAIAVETKKSLPWESAVVECVNAYKAVPQNVQKMGSITNPFDSKRSLSCAWRNLQGALYQAVLDVKFSKIDQEIEKYLKSLDGDTGTVKATEELSKTFSETSSDNDFSKKYIDACKTIITDAVKIAEDNKFGITTNDLTKDIIWSDKDNKCMNLASKKIKAYKDVWAVVLTREAAKAYSNSRENYFSDIRRKYEKLLFKILTYVWKLWEIKDKWNTVTKKANNQ